MEGVMQARAKVFRDDSVQILRYAVIFGGVVSLILLITNAENTIRARYSSYSAPAQVSP